MNLRAHVGQLLAQRRDGCALPGAFFAGEALYGAQLGIIFEFRVNRFHSWYEERLRAARGL